MRRIEIARDQERNRPARRNPRLHRAGAPPDFGAYSCSRLFRLALSHIDDGESRRFAAVSGRLGLGKWRVNRDGGLSGGGSAGWGDSTLGTLGGMILFRFLVLFFRILPRFENRRKRSNLHGLERSPRLPRFDRGEVSVPGWLKVRSVVALVFAPISSRLRPNFEPLQLIGQRTGRHWLLSPRPFGPGALFNLVQVFEELGS